MKKILAIESLSIEEIHADPANVRQHPPESIAAIKASLKRFGQQKPIVIDANGVCRAGNGTLQAAKELGFESIDCVRSDLSGSELTAYAVADNHLSDLSKFDPQVADILNDLKTELPDLSSDFKFDDLLAEFSIPADATGEEFDESCADDVEFLTCPHCQKQFPK